MFYTNRSSVTKTFHGVTFRPGDTKEVFGVINDPKMALSSTRQEPPKRGRRSSSKPEPKASVVKEEPKVVEATATEVQDVAVEAESSLEPQEIVENKEV